MMHPPCFAGYILVVCCVCSTYAELAHTFDLTLQGPKGVVMGTGVGIAFLTAGVMRIYCWRHTPVPWAARPNFSHFEQHLFE